MTLRPNAIDFRADALSSHTLLTHSAAQLVDPERQLAALRLVHWYLPGWFLGSYSRRSRSRIFGNSGRAAATRDALRRRFGNEVAVRFAFGAILGLIVRVAALLPSLYLFRVERAMSQSDQLLRAWSIDWLVVTLLWMLAVGFVTAAVLWLVDRTHAWYIYAIVTILAASFVASYIAPFVATPLFDVVAPMPARAAPSVREIEAMAHVTHAGPRTNPQAFARWYGLCDRPRANATHHDRRCNRRRRESRRAGIRRGAPTWQRCDRLTMEDRADGRVVADFRRGDRGWHLRSHRLSRRRRPGVALRAGRCVFRIALSRGRAA